MPGFLSPGKGKGVPLLLIPEYSGINKGRRAPDRSKTAHRKPLVKCFLTSNEYSGLISFKIIGLVSFLSKGLSTPHFKGPQKLL